MDNLAFITYSKQKIKKPLATANQFFIINNIIYNKDKIKIINNIKINHNTQDTIKIDNYNVQVFKPYENIKHLRILISSKNFNRVNRKAFVQISLQIIKELLNIIEKKKSNNKLITELL